MKNLTLLSLASLSAIALVGCGGGGTKTTTNAAQTETAAATAASEPTAPTTVAAEPAPTATDATIDPSPETTASEAVARPMPRGGSSLKLIKLEPSNFGWGQSVQIGWQVLVDGKPMKNASVRFWVSGHHGHHSGNWFATTGADGKVYKTATMPSNANNYYDWLDLSAVVDKYGLSFGPQRIKG